MRASTSAARPCNGHGVNRCVDAKQRHRHRRHRRDNHAHPIARERIPARHLNHRARGRASSFEIRYTVEFSIKPPGDGDGGDDGAAGDGDNESRPRTVTLRRALDYDPTRQLQSEAESTFLESAMRIEAAVQIMQYLGARLESPPPHSPSIR